jgi:tetratricopeptide (TPR) repeat protein
MSCLATRVRRLENRVGDHIAVHQWTAPTVLLTLLRDEVREVHTLAAGSTAAMQTRLSQSFALLVTMAADAFLKLGDVRRAERGFASAERAADATGNARLRAGVRAQHALLPYYYGHVGEAVDLAREAQRLLPETGGDTAALAYATAARALARGGDHDDARAALWRAETLLDGSAATDDSLRFSRKRFLLYASGVFTHLGDSAGASAVQEEALRLYDAEPGNVLGPALIRLDRAVGMAERGDVVAACGLARAVAVRLPAEHRDAIVVNRMSDVLRAVPESARAQTPATDLRTLLGALPNASAHGSMLNQ